VADVTVPPQGEEQAYTGLQADPPVDGQQQLQQTSPPPGAADGVSSGAARPTLSRRWRRVIWAALGSLLVFAAFQGLQWRWRKAWMWVDHPHLTRPRTIPNALEAGMSALMVFKWAQGVLAPRGQSSPGPG
jgi:hypothetical protein